MHTGWWKHNHGTVVALHVLSYLYLVFCLNVAACAYSLRDTKECFFCRGSGLLDPTFLFSCRGDVIKVDTDILSSVTPSWGSVPSGQRSKK